MAIYKNKESFKVEGTLYSVGDEVTINSDECEFNGMKGSIFEIRTDEDKESENEGNIEFHCSFNIEDAHNKSILTKLKEEWDHPIDVFEFGWDYLIMAAKDLD